MEDVSWSICHFKAFQGRNHAFTRSYQDSDRGAAWEVLPAVTQLLDKTRQEPWNIKAEVESEIVDTEHNHVLHALAFHALKSRKKNIRALSVKVQSVLRLQLWAPSTKWGMVLHTESRHTSRRTKTLSTMLWTDLYRGSASQHLLLQTPSFCDDLYSPLSHRIRVFGPRNFKSTKWEMVTRITMTTRTNRWGGMRDAGGFGGGIVPQDKAARTAWETLVITAECERVF